jgi:uncharacterized protein DUF6455
LSAQRAPIVRRRWVNRNVAQDWRGHPRQPIYWQPPSVPPTEYALPPGLVVMMGAGSSLGPAPIFRWKRCVPCQRRFEATFGHLDRSRRAVIPFQKMLRDIPTRRDMSDLCFSWPMLNHVLSQAELMDQMMSRLGVNPAVAARIDRGAAFYAARTKCIDCPSGGSCRCWLASSDASPGPPDFCPIAAFFEECAKRQVITTKDRH